MGAVLTYIGIILGIAVLGAGLVVAGAMAQYHWYGKPELDEIRSARDAAWARTDRAEREIAVLVLQKAELDRVRRTLAAENGKLHADRHYLQFGQHAIDKPDPRHPDAISAEIIDTRDPFYKQLGPIPTLDMTISGNLRIPKELFDAATVPSGSVAS